jgi:hypothetical protein
MTVKITMTMAHPPGNPATASAAGRSVLTIVW